LKITLPIVFSLGMAAIWNFAALGCYCITHKINSSVLNNKIVFVYNVEWR